MVHVLTACEQDQDGTGSVMILLEICQQTCMTYTIAMCTMKNSWWWTEELSETCRILFQIRIWEIGASSWFYYNKEKRLCCSYWIDMELTFLNHVGALGKYKNPVRFPHKPVSMSYILLADQLKWHNFFLVVSRSANLYGIHHCCVYSENLLMMDRKTAWNM
jgi:hypothetical protein